MYGNTYAAIYQSWLINWEYVYPFQPDLCCVLAMQQINSFEMKIVYYQHYFTLPWTVIQFSMLREIV